MIELRQIFYRPSFLHKLLTSKVFSKAKVDLRDSAAEELPLAKDIAVFVPTIMYLDYNHM